MSWLPRSCKLVEQISITVVTDHTSLYLARFSLLQHGVNHDILIWSNDPDQRIIEKGGEV